MLFSALPVWMATAALLLRDYDEQRNAIERNARATVRALMLSVDRDLASAQTAAEVLGSSPTLLAGDLKTFHARALLGLHPTIGNNVVLTDATGQQVLNTLVPYGEALPRHGDPQLVRRIFQERQPVISDLYAGGLLHRPVLSVDVPVIRDDQVIYDLSIGLFPDRLGELLRQEGLPASWVAAIFDSKGMIVARTHAPEEFIGHLAAPGLLQQLANQREGFVETRTLEGIPVSSTFVRSDISDWAVAIGIPTAELTAPLWRSLGRGLAGTLALACLGILAAVLLSERLARPIRALVGPAHAIGRGERVAVPPLGLAEADELGRALVAGAQLLARRTAERDATERARQQTLAAKEQSQHQARVRSSYFAYLSHELRSPLTAILGYVELLAATASDFSEREQRYLENMEQGGRHMLALINEILDYARYEAKEIELALQPVDLPNVLRGVVDLFTAQAERAQIALSLETGADLPRVTADPTRLRQIAINLVSNALKFTPAGGAVRVAARTSAEGMIILEVADTGVGIAPEDLPRVMEPFGQIMDPQSRKHHGTGLGLPLTKGLVELHGGTFDIASTVGAGTIVTVRLPVGEQASRAGASEQQAL